MPKNAKLRKLSAEEKKDLTDLPAPFKPPGRYFAYSMSPKLKELAGELGRNAHLQHPDKTPDELLGMLMLLLDQAQMDQPTVVRHHDFAVLIRAVLHDLGMKCAHEVNAWNINGPGDNPQRLGREVPKGHRCRKRLEAVGFGYNAAEEDGAI